MRIFSIESRAAERIILLSILVSCSRIVKVLTTKVRKLESRNERVLLGREQTTSRKYTVINTYEEHFDNVSEIIHFSFDQERRLR